MKMTCCQWPILLHFQLVKKIFMLWTQVCAKPAASGSPSWNFWGCRVMMQGCAHPDGKGVIRFQEVIILCLQVRFCLWQICNISSSCSLDIIMQSYSRVLVGVLVCFSSICFDIAWVLYGDFSYTLYLLAGDHEYIDVVRYNDTGGTERVVIDIDFRSHFEIARAVESYDRILNLLPVIYVGSFSKLKQFLQVMVEAARSSLKQNSMPLPPWRSIAYLLAKWQSPYQRKLDSATEQNYNATVPIDHKKCAGHLKRLHSLLLSEIEVERTLKPYNRDRRVKTERRRYPTFH